MPISSVVELLLGANAVLEGGAVVAAGISAVALLEGGTDVGMPGVVMPINGYSGLAAMVMIGIERSPSSVSDELLSGVVLGVAIGSHDSKTPGGALGPGNVHSGKVCE
jgi:hypothetical protein